MGDGTDDPKDYTNAPTKISYKEIAARVKKLDERVSDQDLSVAEKKILAKMLETEIRDLKTHAKSAAQAAAPEGTSSPSGEPQDMETDKGKEKDPAEEGSSSGTASAAAATPAKGKAKGKGKPRSTKEKDDVEQAKAKDEIRQIPVSMSLGSIADLVSRLGLVD
jgi:hypothetical protein